MQHRWLKPAVVIFIVFQLLIAGNIVYNEISVGGLGKEYKFLCTYYDPVQPFVGRYLELNPGSPCVPVRDSATDKSTSYFVVLKDSGGFHYPDYITYKRPESSIGYLEINQNTRISWFNLRVRDCKTVNYPFTRFYLAAEDAPRAEKLVNESLRDTSTQVWISVNIYRGKYQVNDVFINGKSLKASLNN